MADLNSVQSFANPNFSVEPVVRRSQQQGGTTPLNMLELANTARSMTALQKEQALLQPTIEQGIAQSKKAQLEYQRENYTIANSALAGLESSKSLKTNDIEGVKKEYEATHDWLKNMGVSGDGKFYQQGKEFLEKKDLEGYKNHLSNLRNQATPISQQYSANLPQLTTVGGQPTLFNQAQGQVSPVGGLNQPAPVVAQPEARGNQSGVMPSQMNMPQMQYPVRKAGEAYAQLPNEPKDLEEGRAYRGNLVSAQTDLTKMRRNIDEVIKEADILEKTEWNKGAGVMGKVGRELSTFLGTEEGVRYKQLSKDLANAQITAIQASGGNLNTDAGKQLARMANGDETYPPKVLKQIARRTQADMTNIDMQATAAQKFAQLYGDQNINTFKQLWSANADSKMFELKNIYDNPNISAEEKDKFRNELLGTDKKSLEDYARKWKNIQKLEKTGSL
jgi:hypothetical protein